MKLPPLHAVRAFEAAARHGSMRDAAAELFVTPGAISQQVRVLESYLGVPLFVRSPRAIRLTEAGAVFQSAANRHLRGIAQAAAQVEPARQRVALSVAPDFASRWLMPRLGRFATLHPQVEVRIDATFELADFERDPFDLAIRVARGQPPSLHATTLLTQSLRPYCSVEYHKRVFAGRPKAAAWTHARLLHENHPHDLWSAWFAMRRFTEPNAEVGLYFSHGALAIAAAIDGEGVTLQPPEYVDREVASRALIAADPTLLVTGMQYSLVWPKRPLRPAAEVFKAWLLETVRGEAPAAPQGRAKFEARGQALARSSSTSA